MLSGDRDNDSVLCYGAREVMLIVIVYFVRFAMVAGNGAIVYDSREWAYVAVISSSKVAGMSQLNGRGNKDVV